MNMKGSFGILAGIALVLGLGATALSFNNLDNGERAVARNFFGDTEVIFEAGPFFNFLGDVEKYPDFMGLDFTSSKGEALPDDTYVTDFTYAPEVKYNEGGIGWIKGNVQFALPGDAENMLALHKKFKSASNLQTSLMLRTTEEALQFTAGLMSSQEAYMTHRTQFRSFAKDQIDNGLYATRLIDVVTIGADGKSKTEQLPKVYEVDGNRVRADESPIDAYGIRLTQFNIKDWDFEQKTKDQIALKRDAENEVITSKARTAKAEQAKLEAVAVADKNKAVAQGEANVIKAKKVIEAQQAAELAVIAATQKVDVAAQELLEKEQQRLTAIKQAKITETISVADAEAANRKIKAGGTLTAAQRTEIEINSVWAKAYAARPVPQYNVGDNSQGGTSIDATQRAMETLTLKAAKDLVASEAK